VYRFLQGYAYPSFTGTTLTGFKSPEAVQMWQTLRRLWSVTNEWSTTYKTMQEPLRTGEVWIAWDHQARLQSVLADSTHFKAVPAPSGPRGLGYMTALVGLAIPRGARHRAGAEALIDWLTRPAQQATAGASLGFLPTVQGVNLTGSAASASLTAEAGVEARYTSDRNAVAALPPVGLGSDTDKFTEVYQDTFRRIILNDQDIPAVLNDEAARLQSLIDHARAPCWLPDPRSSDPCQME
jgi:multiple sugar transport system substrate-binding protein